MKILVLGSNGQLGRCLRDQLAPSGHEMVFLTRTNVDITDFDKVLDKIRQLNPDLIINAVAYTAVDEAENDQEQAYLVNQHAVGNLAEICANFGCGLIHVSTDYVFDGRATEPYSETDRTNPQGVYGGSKLLGEMAIQASGCQYIIVRTAWVFSEYGNNFLKTMLSLATKNNELSIVGDQIGCPTYAQDLACVILRLSGYFQENEFKSGIVHYCGGEPCSWYQFALAIFECAAHQGLSTPKLVKSIGTESYPTPAVRPAYSVMDCRSLYRKVQMPPSEWRRAIPLVLNKLL